MHDVNFLVCYNILDKDHFLYVTRRDRLERADQVVFTGTEVECRRYVVQHQGDSSTPSLRKVLGPKPPRVVKE